MNEKRIVKIAEDEVKKFAKEWKKNPYLWESEADIHAELYNRIKNCIDKPSEYKYDDMEKAGKFNWIYCKPKTYLKGKRNCYYPDIVIYKKGSKIRKVSERQNEPMLWVCEIKYITNWSSLLSKESVENDIRKLTCLLNQKRDGAERSYYLIFHRKVPLAKNIKKILKNMDERIKPFIYPEDVDEK